MSLESSGRASDGSTSRRSTSDASTPDGSTSRRSTQAAADASDAVGAPARYTPPPGGGLLDTVGNLLRGILISMAELVPGVSGGTVALVTGIYERALAAGSLIVDIVRAAVTGPDRVTRIREGVRRLDWWLLIPVGIGMVAMVFSMASVMQNFVDNYTTIAYSLFLGMVAASITVPVTMARASKPLTGVWRGGLYFVIGGAVGFLLSSLPSGSNPDPAPWLVFIAAAIAICALVLPGISGSYLLLAMGLYSTTMGAVADRDLGYIAIFIAGALFGLALFIKVLDRLLTDYRFPTLCVMSGLMLGSLRALWPWQTEDGEVLAPGDDLPAALGFVALGALIVFAVLALERTFGNGKKKGEFHEFHPTENAAQ